MKALKIIAGVAFAMIMMKACEYDHACEIAESIPANCLDRILEDHPEVCESTLALAEFWEAKKDSIMNDVRITECAKNHWALWK